MEMLQLSQIDFVETRMHGGKNFIAGMCRKLGVNSVINEDIPYGTQAEILLTNICDDRAPLYRLKDYYKKDDLQGIFKTNLSLDQINDDRFGNFLDHFYEANPKKIFSPICSNALSQYRIIVKNINFDTTSKVMWGEYETEERKIGCIEINFGHSKDKRSDKKQIKVGIGTANGLLVDAQVLSGNENDKTYNKEKIKDIEDILKSTKTNKDTFYYIADSALFTENNLREANERKVHLITRMPENTKLAKELINQAVENKEKMNPISFLNAHKKEVNYGILSLKTEYKGIPLKAAICYSESLRGQKIKTIHKEVQREEESLILKLKAYKKRDFVCKEDAQKEILLLQNKFCSKLKYHSISFEIKEIQKRTVGRPSTFDSGIKTCYELHFKVQEEKIKIEKAIEQGSMFILVSTDLKISGEDILKEYKTQSSVEERFKNLKSHEFVNALYIKTPKRVEALMYLILIGLMILSVCEYVVRREMQKENDTIIGPGGVKMKKPTLRSILLILKEISYKTIANEDGILMRHMSHKLEDAQQKILHYLGLDKDIFIG